MQNHNITFTLIKEIVGPNSYSDNELMKNHTTFKVGGPAELMVSPSDEHKLCEIIKICNKYNIPYFILGNGSNLIVTDKGIKGVVIKISDNFNKINVNCDIIEAEAGLLLSSISSIALKNELSGLEFASGIPGSLGGAIAMNAGAYGFEMKAIIYRTVIITPSGELKMLEKDDHNFGYRTSIIQQKKYIVIKSFIKLQKGDYEDIKQSITALNSKRRDKQPLEFPSAGSVFKRPEGYFAGKLIQDSGLAGYSIGGAQVSSKHCGFIINKGNATANDIITLIDHIKSTVKSKFGVQLETEVKIIGEK